MDFGIKKFVQKDSGGKQQGGVIIDGDDVTEIDEPNYTGLITLFCLFLGYLYIFNPNLEFLRPGYDGDELTFLGFVSVLSLFSFIIFGISSIDRPVPNQPVFNAVQYQQVFADKKGRRPT